MGIPAVTIMALVAPGLLKSPHNSTASAEDPGGRGWRKPPEFAAPRGTLGMGAEVSAGA